ncbi:hypothetical protein NP493_2106g00002 [Ridgeia piscesae]|uniref:F-box domain-containing protein n=1 Tax=Ridgeia piscesae TaxID=27915 RepID=A0AAD9JL02_RIDPI|nr:hypothetical protein NP493_2106g00002 [Ridgeia piscesae]
MSRPILLRIINYLELEDTAQLSQVSHLFNELCESDELWESIYHKHSPMPVTHDLVTLAQAIGWKKLFFTNKLQIQVQIRRHRQRTGHDWTPVVLDDSDWSSDMQLNSDYDLA